MDKKVLLIILDGFGINESNYGNAIKAAHTPFIDELMDKYQVGQLSASGLDVGLPAGQMGNSEVGHTNIGAGRIVYQDLTRINKSIEDGDFFENEVLLEAMQNAKNKGKTLHLMGLLSDGGVHSHIDQLFSLIDMAKKNGVTDVLIHCFTDGRDVDPKSGHGFLTSLQAKLDEAGIGKIASVMGRYYAMDRDKRWDRVEKAYNAVALADAAVFEDIIDGVKQSYEKGVTDEFIEPMISPYAKKMETGDSVIFFNFRPDRARELTRAITEEGFDKFRVAAPRRTVEYVCMTTYDAKFANVKVAFKPQSLKNSFGEYISSLGLTQLRIAETEKYAHVTFFFNGGREEPFEGEDRKLINSPKVATYDLKPDMSAFEVTDALLEKMNEKDYNAIILNYANSDMVGHTGVFDAATKAVEAVDKCLEKLVPQAIAKKYTVIITADHGNSDKMLNDDGSPFTAHTTNPVPLIVVSADEIRLREGGVLADIAPTMLDIMDLEKPKEMTGLSLILR